MIDGLLGNLSLLFSFVDIRKSVSQGSCGVNSKLSIMRSIAESDKIVLHESPLRSTASTAKVTDCSSVALIILNSPSIGTTISPLLRRLWEISGHRICADGGANRLHAMAEKDEMIPDTIVGDLDSLRENVRSYYEERGVNVIHDYDQDRNDLDKALKVAVDGLSCTSCLVFGAFGGRFDQEMASIQALFSWHQRTKIWMYDDHTMAFLLTPEANNIIELALPSLGGYIHEGPTCGLIPIGERCESVSTTGLRWNLNHQATEMGGLVSTSNKIVDSQVHVEASSSLVFTAEITVIDS